jgi:hypothetical protein
MREDDVGPQSADTIKLNFIRPSRPLSQMADSHVWVTRPAVDLALIHPVRADPDMPAGAELEPDAVRADVPRHGCGPRSDRGLTFLWLGNEFGRSVLESRFCCAGV